MYYYVHTRSIVITGTEVRDENGDMCIWVALQIIDHLESVIKYSWTQLCLTTPGKIVSFHSYYHQEYTQNHNITGLPTA